MYLTTSLLQSWNAFCQQKLFKQLASKVFWEARVPFIYVWRKSFFCFVTGNCLHRFWEVVFLFFLRVPFLSADLFLKQKKTSSYSNQFTLNAQTQLKCTNSFDLVQRSFCFFFPKNARKNCLPTYKLKIKVVCFQTNFKNFQTLYFTSKIHLVVFETHSHKKEISVEKVHSEWKI